MNNKTLTVKTAIAILLNLILGANFLLSAYSKLPSIEVFGWTIAESTPFNWTVSEWLARLVIGLEFFLGIVFILQLFTKKIAVPFSIFLILFFSAYLIYILSAYGNESNCGCYGEMIPLSTKESLYKNGVILLLLLLAVKFSYEIKFKFNKIAALLFAALAFGLPFYFSPPASITIFTEKKIENEIVPLGLIQEDENFFEGKKKIIATVSPTCKYCKKAAKRMGILKKRNPEIPFLLVMAGHKDHLNEFYEVTRAKNIPLIFMDSLQDFKRINARSGVPTIKWLEDISVIKTSTYFSLSENEILDWLKK
jgi:uncharacterized membrane protein YphA (DoxX/SURF4 family)